VAIGDVSADRAVVWVNTGAPTRALVEVRKDGRAPNELLWRSAPLDPAQPPAAPTLKVQVEGLPADTALVWRVQTGDGRTATGTFHTAAMPDDPVPVSLVVGGDLGGQGWCRPPGGYAIFDAMAALHPDLAVFNGDMIYADGDCPPQAPDGSDNVQLPGGNPRSVMDVDWTDATATRRALDAWWAYHRADPAFQRFLSTVPVVAQWDDHEVVNDFGANWERWGPDERDRPGYRILVEQARRAFLAWNPIIEDRDPSVIHRRFRWGRNLELLVVDARSNRSENAAPDGPDKTMLGHAQLSWMLDALDHSDATWKVLSIDVPLSEPTGSDAWREGRDGWASGTGDPSTPAGQTDTSAGTGFEHELGAIFDHIREHHLTGVVVVTTDVHHSRLIRYDNGGVPVTEVISGPLRAWSGAPPALDPSFHPKELFAEGKVFNFARLAVAQDGTLTVEIRGEDGQIRPGGSLVLPPTVPVPAE